MTYLTSWIPVRNSTTETIRQLLTFMIAGDEYGVDVLRVEGVHSWSEMTQLSNAHHYIRGTVTLLGELVAIADLRQRLGLPGFHQRTAFVIVVLLVDAKSTERRVGLLVDSLSQIVATSNPVLESNAAAGGGTHHLRAGVVTCRTRPIIIIEPDRIFDVTPGARAAAA